MPTGIPNALMAEGPVHTRSRDESDEASIESNLASMDGAFSLQVLPEGVVNSNVVCRCLYQCVQVWVLP